MFINYELSACFFIDSIACSVPLRICFLIIPVNMPANPDILTSQLASSKEPPSLDLRFSVFEPLIIPSVNSAWILSLGYRVIFCRHLESLNAITISLVIKLPSREMIFDSLVPFQNFGSASRSEIISQTFSIDALISMDVSIVAIWS